MESNEEELNISPVEDGDDGIVMNEALYSEDLDKVDYEPHPVKDEDDDMSHKLGY